MNDTFSKKKKWYLFIDKKTSRVMALLVDMSYDVESLSVSQKLIMTSLVNLSLVFDIYTQYSVNVTESTRKFYLGI